ncbi:MAG: glycine--tRNA ligase subunit beta [Pseudomonadota bacterium]|nr:glycine--tRNA ligase subunit beta [Pseudomonadota bacterium]
MQFLLEILSEEIPARMQRQAAGDLGRLIGKHIEAAGLATERIEVHVTPRRLVLVAEGLPMATPDRKNEKKGPRVGSPERATDGFLRGTGLSSLDQCEKRDTGKGVFWFAVLDEPGRATTQILREAIIETVATFPWPKSMRWGCTRKSWVRPIHSIIAIFDGELIEGAIDLDGMVIPFGDTTVGNRFMAPASFRVADFADYKAKLEAAYVILDREERKTRIAKALDDIAAATGFVAAPDPGLLEEVAGLVEYPVPLMGGIDAGFMNVPKEVLITSMRTHQKYFALLTEDGAMAPHFVVIANTITENDGAMVVIGNERVLRARLADARFFWDQDRKTPLEYRIKDLEAVTFHAKLGKVSDKVARIETLAREIAIFVPGADKERCARAARLSKADLTTGMVYEFPELQGIMGEHYARHDGEDLAVAHAIAEHYKPLGPNDSCPKGAESIAVSLADKIDSLTGFFIIGELPTGSKDPYALRRAALGIIRIVLEDNLRVPLARLFDHAHALYALDGAPPASDVTPELLDFIAERLKVALREKGIRHDLIDAVFSQARSDDLLQILARVDALSAFLASDDGANLLIAYRRAANILRIEEKKDGVVYDGAVDPAQLIEPQEKKLLTALNTAASTSDPAMTNEDYAIAMAAMATLRAPVDAFFDHVTVNANEAELRRNRLHLLSQIRRTLHGVADFSRIEG